MQILTAWLFVVCAMLIIIALVLWIVAKNRRLRIVEFGRMVESMREEKQAMNKRHDQLISQLDDAISKAAKAEEKLPRMHDNLELLKASVISQFDLLKALIDKSYYAKNDSDFISYFKKTIATARTDNDSIWTNLRLFVDFTNNNLIEKLSKRYPELKSYELTFISLMCCGFSRIEIMICMKYINDRTVLNTRRTIEKKLKIEIPLEKYLQKLINHEIEI